MIKTARVTPLAQLCDRFDGREKTLVAWRVFVRWQVVAMLVVMVMVMTTVAMTLRMRRQPPPR